MMKMNGRSGYVLAVAASAAAAGLFYKTYVPLTLPFQTAFVPVLAAAFLLAAANAETGTLFFLLAMPLVNSLPYFFGLYENVPQAAKTAIAEALVGVNEEVIGVQHYFGPNTATGGPMGFAMVMECRDPMAVRKHLKELAVGMGDVFKHLRIQEGGFAGEILKEVFAKFVVTHSEGQKVGEYVVDVVNIEHEELNKAMAEEGDEMRIKFKAIWGDDRFRILIAQPAANTLVITFGGGEKLLAEAVKAADTTNRIEAAPEVKAMIARLPGNRTGVCLLNAGNAANVFVNMAALMGSQPPPFRCACKTMFTTTKEGFPKSSYMPFIISLVPRMSRLSILMTNATRSDAITAFIEE